MSRFLAACLVAASAAACGSADDNPNAGLLRDFEQQSKFDEYGHPANAEVLRAPCPNSADGCSIDLPLQAQAGNKVVNLWVRGKSAELTIRDGDGRVVAEQAFTDLGDKWRGIHLPYNSGPNELRQLTIAGDIELEYLEVFPERFGLVLSPGSDIITPDTTITIAARLAGDIAIEYADQDIRQELETLLQEGTATLTRTSFRRVWEVPAAALLAGRPPGGELFVSIGGNAARMELRYTERPCIWEGETGPRVLVSGVRPFPADGWHENISEIAVREMAQHNDIRVLRVVLPVEYDHAAKQLASLARRCDPDVVVSFGQGGNQLALEQVGYNLQDTGSVAGGVPDNRGRILSATPIRPDGPQQLPATLPLASMAAALDELGQDYAYSEDPGRYICNNVLYEMALLASTTDTRVGFVHLPYTTVFSDEERKRWGLVADTLVRSAALD